MTLQGVASQAQNNLTIHKEMYCITNFVNVQLCYSTFFEHHEHQCPLKVFSLRNEIIRPKGKAAFYAHFCGGEAV